MFTVVSEHERGEHRGCRFLDGGEGDTGLEHERGVRVPQLVEADRYDDGLGWTLARKRTLTYVK